MSVEDLSWLTQERFDKELARIVKSEGCRGVLLSIPGIYEIVSEHFNNEVIKNLSDRRSKR